MPSPKAIGGISDLHTVSHFTVLRYYCNRHGQQASDHTCPSHSLLGIKLLALRRIYTPLNLHSIESLSYHRLLRLSSQKSGKRRAPRPFFWLWRFTDSDRDVHLDFFVCSALSSLRSSTSTIQDKNTGGRSMSIGSRLCTSTAKKSRRVAGTD